MGGDIYDTECFGEGTGVGLRQGETALLDALNAAIQQTRDDGSYVALSNEYSAATSTASDPRRAPGHPAPCPREDAMADLWEYRWLLVIGTGRTIALGLCGLVLALVIGLVTSAARIGGGESRSGWRAAIPTLSARSPTCA